MGWATMFWWFTGMPLPLPWLRLLLSSLRGTLHELKSEKIAFLGSVPSEIYWFFHVFFLCSRKAQPKITFRVFMQIFVLALLGLVSFFFFFFFFSCIIANMQTHQSSSCVDIQSDQSKFVWIDRPVIDQNFYYAGLKLTSPTFSCAMSNMLPAMTFVMAVIFRYDYQSQYIIIIVMIAVIILFFGVWCIDHMG